MYRSFNRSTTCIGVDEAERAVKPTISEKYIVTCSNVSATTDKPLMSCEATDLGREKNKTNDNVYYLNIIHIHVFFLEEEKEREKGERRQSLKWPLFSVGCTVAGI